MKNIKRSLVALLMIIVTALHTSAQVSVGLSVRIGPPLLPVYTQPLCPGDGYLWIPGYWANTAEGYYWVPGEWVRPPHYGLLWTPGYWSFGNGLYNWRPGYWGPHVGFYGGINYGFGYGGVGYGGGMWRGNAFHYNTAVTNVNTTVIHNTYVNKTVINNTTVVNNRNSFNGQGGVNAKPNPQEQLALREHHIQPTSAQLSHESSARADRSQFASVNHGRPARLAVDGATNYNHAANRQNNTTPITNTRDNANQNRPISNNYNKTINNQNVNRQLPSNGIKPERQPGINNGQIRNEQMNARTESKPINMNPEHARNEPRNIGAGQTNSHHENEQRADRGNRH